MWSAKVFILMCVHSNRANAPSNLDVRFDPPTSLVTQNNCTPTPIIYKHMSASPTQFSTRVGNTKYVYMHASKPYEMGLDLVENRRRNLDLGLQVCGYRNCLPFGQLCTMVCGVRNFINTTRTPTEIAKSWICILEAVHGSDKIAQHFVTHQLIIFVSTCPWQTTRAGGCSKSDPCRRRIRGYHDITFIKAYIFSWISHFVSFQYQGIVIIRIDSFAQRRMWY